MTLIWGIHKLLQCPERQLKSQEEASMQTGWPSLAAPFCKA